MSNEKPEHTFKTSLIHRVSWFLDFLIFEPFWFPYYCDYSLLQQFPYIFVIFNPRVAEIEFNLDLDYNILAFKVKYVKYAFFQDDSQNLA